MGEKEAWTEDTGRDIIKVAGQGIVTCGALAVFGLTLGAVGPYIGGG